MRTEWTVDLKRDKNLPRARDLLAGDTFLDRDGNAWLTLGDGEFVCVRQSGRPPRGPGLWSKVGTGYFQPMPAVSYVFSKSHLTLE